MKAFPIVAIIMLSSFVLIAEVIDLTDFEPPIGSVYWYEGTYGRAQSPLEAVVTYLDGSDVITGSRRTHEVLTYPESEWVSTTNAYAMDGALLRDDVEVVDKPSNEAYQYSILYTPAWTRVPRMVEPGKTYEASTSSSYQVEKLGNFVDLTMSATGTVVGIEWITVPAGTFEALKWESTVITTELTNGNRSWWQKTVSTETLWTERFKGVLVEDSKQVREIMATFQEGKKVWKEKVDFLNAGSTLDHVA